MPGAEHVVLSKEIKTAKKIYPVSLCWVPNVMKPHRYHHGVMTETILYSTIAI